MNTQSELDRLTDIAAVKGYKDGIIDEKIHARLFHIFSGMVRRGATLEIGPAEGVVTGLMAGKMENLTLLEPTPSMADDLEKRFPQATVARELIENWSPQTRFENIFAMHVLEHVMDSRNSLKKISGWLADGGRIFVSVPNAMSIHRQAGVAMGILKNPDSPSKRDLAIGHRRVYTPESLKKDIEDCGLRVVKQGGTFIKIASTAQIKQWNWGEDLTDALLSVGELHPEIAADIYAVAEK